MASRHLTLVGTHAAGKSTICNLLVADDRKGPFKVGDLISAQTTGITSETMKDPHNWVVYDTPGLGDVPPREQGESDATYNQKARANSTNYFNQITRHLKDCGGVVLYVYKAAMALDCNQKQANNMKALGKVVRSLGTGVVLVVTNIPVQYYENEKLCVDNPDPEELAEYGNFLQKQRGRCEDAFGSQVAAVVGVHNGKLSSTHVAHHKQLVALLSSPTGLQWKIAPGTVMLWENVMADLYKAKELSDQLRTSIGISKGAIEQLKGHVRWYDKTVQGLENRVLLSIINLMWVVSGVVGEATTTVAGVPGLGTLVVASGNVAYETQRAAILGLCRSRLGLNKKAIEHLQKKMQDDEQVRAQLCIPLEGEKAFKVYMEEMKRLVYC